MSVSKSGLEYLYKGKPIHYFNLVRRDLIAFVEPGRHRILEIGCGMGSTGYALKEIGKAIEVVGIELEESAALLAKSKLDRVLCTDIEHSYLPYPAEYFDYIICGDVLEHLHDPWNVVKKLNPYLKIGGFLIASIPNVRNWRILKDLAFRGRWEYTSYGLLDNTHLRFFTKSSIIEMYEKAGFTVGKLYHNQFGFEAGFMNRLTLRLLEEFLVKQYIVKGRKNGS